MPLNVNNVDVTVAANGIFGTTAAILNGLVKPDILDDPEVQVHVTLQIVNAMYIAVRLKFSVEKC